MPLEIANLPKLEESTVVIGRTDRSVNGPMAWIFKPNLALIELGTSRTISSAKLKCDASKAEPDLEKDCKVI